MAVLDRAYSCFEIKSFDEELRTIEGIATTPKVDRVGDIVETLGLTFAKSVPLLLHHDSRLPVGQVTFGKPTKNGLPFTATLPKVSEPGTIKDRVDEAWQSVKYKLIAAVSIGFRPLDDAIERIETGWRFLKSEIMELSLVVVPAQDQAVITGFKSMDAAALAVIKQFDTDVPAATGHLERPSNPPGVTGKTPMKPVNLMPKEGKTMSKTIQEQISALEAKRAANAARMAEIMQKSTDEGRTTDAAEQEEFDTLDAENAPIDADLKRFRALEKAQVIAARPVVQEARTFEQGSDLRALRPSVQVRRELPKGTLFVRLMGARWLAKEQGISAIDVARDKFGDTPEVEMMLRAGINSTNIVEKTAVAAGNTTNATWAAPLVVAQNMASEFAELLRAQTIIGRIPGLRQVPFNISVPRGTTDPTSYWVGQGDVKPVSSMAFDSISLAFHKVAGIVPITEELLRFSNPAAEGIIRDALIASVAYLTDRDFLDPSKAETTGVSPASLTNGVTPIAATGITADALRSDMGDLLATYLGLNQSPAGLTLVMTASQAMRLSLMRNTLGQREFPDISMSGGTLEGIPVVTSENIVATGSSPTDGYPIIAINAPEVMIADDGGVAIDVSREASLQMDTAPDSPETASTVLVSLWQRNMVAIKAERFITWKKRRTGAVQFISYAKYEEA